VARVLRVDPTLVKPVLCFVGNTGIEGWARDVMLTTPENLVTMLLSRPVVVDSRTVSQLLLALQLGLDSARRGPSAPPATPLRRSPVRRSRPRTARRGRRPLAALLMFLGTVVAVLVGSRLLVSLADDVAQGVVGLGATDRTAAEHRLGQKVTLPAAAHRPRLQITADRARTVHRVGTTPYLFDGHRFFGVRLTIHNGGTQPWVSEPGTSYSVTDTSGIPHAGGTAIHIREGQMLTDPTRVPAGGTVQGYVVFQVPVQQPLTGLSVTVGPGKPSTAMWVIERQ
ncbi:MAG TPA: hypothetical protein VMT27_05420, partial [Actinomycetes bacterium]|nr:hypothetical protein [Actinomycetes bacterium]